MGSAATRALAFVPTALVVGVSLAGAAQAGTVNPVQNSTYSLTPANNPITFGTGANINAPGPAVYGAAGTDWNVTNQGKLAGASGIVFFSDGTVSNSGAITSTGMNGFGIVITTGVGTVTNDGSITATQPGAFGVVLTAGGSVTNNSDGTITSNHDGVVIEGGAGTFVNAGTIVDNSTAVTGVAVVIEGGGTVTNNAGGVLTGNTGVYNKAGDFTLTNAGTITGRNDPGVASFSGGTVNNQTGGVIIGGNTGVYAKGASAAVTNAGTITGGNFDGVSLVAGGSVDNQAGGKISGGGKYGVFITGGDGSVTNAGSISAYSTGVLLDATHAGVDNSGSIASTGQYAFGVYLKQGGAVTNETGGSITSARTAVAIIGGAGTVTNSGVLQSSIRDGVFLGAGGQVTNNAGGSITGANVGVVGVGDTTIANAGSISATADGGYGVVVTGGAATVTNQAGGKISGSGGVYVYGGALTLTNAGSVSGTAGNGVTALAGGAVQNAAGGAISGGNYGVFIVGGDASLTNAGSITGVGAGVELDGTKQSVDNAGSIKATGAYGVGVAVIGGGSLTNETGGYIGATDVTGLGVAVTGDGSTLTNSGTLQGGAAGAATIGNGVQVTNNAGATISGGYAGLTALGSANITNAGTISGTNSKASIGVAAIYGATTLANQAGGVISGNIGVYTKGGALTLTNAGSITGTTVGLYAAGGATVTNAGSISGGTDSIVFAGPGANTLTLATGSQLSGDVLGSADANATNALILQGAGEADVNFVNFGTLTAQGPGTWVLGGTSTFGTAEVGGGVLVVDGALTAGATTVDAGTLQVGDAAHAGATLTSPVAVNAGGTLSGHGTVIGDVTNNGTVAPGGTVGTLTITGDYTQSSTGVLQIELTSAGSSRLVVSGTAHLDGALVFDPISGVFRKGQVFDFFDAGAIDGTFSSITFDGPQIFAVSQQGNGFIATTTVGNFALTGGTLNQRAVVPAFNNFPVGVNDFDALASAIIALPGGAAQNLVVNELGSEISPDLINASRDIVRNQLGGFTDELAARGPAGQAGGADPVWIQAVGRFGDVSSDGNAHGFRDTTAGLAGGVQRDFGAATLGGGAAYEQTWLSLHGLPQSGNVATGSVGLYGEERFGSIFADLGGLVGWNHNTEARSIIIGGQVQRSASADFDGFSAGATGLVGDRLALSGGWTLEPRAGFTWSHVDQNGYTEQGAGGADLTVGPAHQDAVESLLGVRVANAFGNGFSGEGSLDWAHDFNDLTPRAAESFAGVPGTGFTFAGVNPGRDAALVRAGVNYKTGQTTFFARYDGSFSNRANDNQVSGGLKVTF